MTFLYRRPDNISAQDRWEKMGCFLMSGCDLWNENLVTYFNQTIITPYQPNKSSLSSLVDTICNVVKLVFLPLAIIGAPLLSLSESYDLFVQNIERNKIITNDEAIRAVWNRVHSDNFSSDKVQNKDIWEYAQEAITKRYVDSGIPRENITIDRETGTVELKLRLEHTPVSSDADPTEFPQLKSLLKIRQKTFEQQFKGFAYIQATHENDEAIKEEIGESLLRKPYEVFVVLKPNSYDDKIVCLAYVDEQNEIVLENVEFSKIEELRTQIDQFENLTLFASQIKQLRGEITIRQFLDQNQHENQLTSSSHAASSSDNLEMTEGFLKLKLPSLTTLSPCHTNIMVDHLMSSIERLPNKDEQIQNIYKIVCYDLCQLIKKNPQENWAELGLLLRNIQNIEDLYDLVLSLAGKNLDETLYAIHALRIQKSSQNTQTLKARLLSLRNRAIEGFVKEKATEFQVDEGVIRKKLVEEGVGMSCPKIEKPQSTIPENVQNLNLTEQLLVWLTIEKLGCADMKLHLGDLKDLSTIIESLFSADYQAMVNEHKKQLSSKESSSYTFREWAPRVDRERAAINKFKSERMEEGLDPSVLEMIGELQAKRKRLQILKEDPKAIFEEPLKTLIDEVREAYYLEHEPKREEVRLGKSKEELRKDIPSMSGEELYCCAKDRLRFEALEKHRKKTELEFQVAKSGQLPEEILNEIRIKILVAAGFLTNERTYTVQGINTILMSMGIS